MTDYLSVIARAVQKGDERLVIQGVSKGLDAGIEANEVLTKGLVPGIQALGELFKSGEAYLPEVLVSTRAMRSGVEQLKPLLTDASGLRRGIVIIGTVEGDMHDIGKNLVKLMLESNGFEVHDLGVDVTVDTFVRAVQDINPDIVGISALLTTTMICIPRIAQAIKEVGLRDSVKIMIGGAPITRAFAEEIGVEGYADDCATAVDEAVKLIKMQTGEGLKDVYL